MRLVPGAPDKRNQTDVFGTTPRGTLMLAADGRFAMILMRSNLPRFAANNRIKGTAEENTTIVQGSVAYFGTWKILSEQENKVGLHVDACTFPNWDGQDQVRIMVVTGDEMKITNPVAAIGGTNHVVLKRVAANAS